MTSPPRVTQQRLVAPLHAAVALRDLTVEARDPTSVRVPLGCAILPAGGYATTVP